jgi:hypothetical protein
MKKIKGAIKGAKETLKNYAGAAKQNVKTVINRQKVVSGMMKNNYVPSQFGEATYDKRRKEALKMVKNSQYKQARDYLSAKKEQFKKDNPLYKG